MPGVNRPDAGHQHFRAVSRADNEFDAGEVAFPAVYIQWQAIKHRVRIKRGIGDCNTFKLRLESETKGGNK